MRVGPFSYYLQLGVSVDISDNIMYALCQCLGCSKLKIFIDTQTQVNLNVDRASVFFSYLHDMMN